MTNPTKLVPVEQWEALRNFAQWRMSQNSPDGPGEYDDDGDLQETALQYGIIHEVESTEPCGERCACAEWDEFPNTCYRLAPWLVNDEAPPQAPDIQSQRVW